MPVRAVGVAVGPLSSPPLHLLLRLPASPTLIDASCRRPPVPVATSHPPLPCSLFLPSLLFVARRVWPHTHYLVLKLPVNFNLAGFEAEVGGLTAPLRRVDLGGKALVVMIDCRANPRAPHGAAPAAGPPAVRLA